MCHFNPKSIFNQLNSCFWIKQIWPPLSNLFYIKSLNSHFLSKYFGVYNGHETWNNYKKLGSQTFSEILRKFKRFYIKIKIEDEKKLKDYVFMKENVP